MEKKIIHEYYYCIGHTDFIKHYELVVDKETDKMLYGTAFDEGIIKGSRFAVRKAELNQIYEQIDRRRGTVYRIQIDDSDKVDVYKKAKDIVYQRLIKIAENFRAYEEILL